MIVMPPALIQPAGHTASMSAEKVASRRKIIAQHHIRARKRRRRQFRCLYRLLQPPLLWAARRRLRPQRGKLNSLNRNRYGNPVPRSDLIIAASPALILPLAFTSERELLAFITCPIRA